MRAKLKSRLRSSLICAFQLLGSLAGHSLSRGIFPHSADLYFFYHRPTNRDHIQSMPHTIIN